MSSQQKIIEESMLAQRGYLEVIKSRHHQWAYATENPEIRRLHLEIAASIQQTMDRYYDLLNTYDSVSESPFQTCSDIFTLYPVSQDA